MEILEQILNTTIASFDFSFCAVTNIATYTTIQTIELYRKNKKLNTWWKRIILLLCVIVIGVVYYFNGADTKLIVNSAILAPVSWSWIFKPIFNKLGIDYKQINK